MKNEKLLNAIGEIDDDLILDAVNDTKKTARQKNLWIRWGGLAAMLVLCFGAGIFSARLFHTGTPDSGSPDVPDTVDAPAIINAADSVILLDVNPSISLTINADEKVVQADGLNEDGILILSDMNLIDVDMTVAVNAVIGSMLQKGYLNDLQNAILVSVENEDAEISAALQERISSIVGNALLNSNLDGTVLSQTISETASLEQISQEYGISLGKAALIQEVISLDPTLTVESLSPLSITEIALISQSKNLAPETLTQAGTASDKAYISRESALDIAYSHANVSAEDVSRVKIEFDSDNGIMVYEVEFYAGTIEYECDIDARTGQVVKYETENKGMTGQNGNPPKQPSDTQPSGSQPPSDGYIGEEAAKNAALTNAGIAADTVKYINAWLDYDDGRPEHYEVEFAVGNVEYKYEIDLYTGAVLSQEMEDYGRYAPDRHDDHRDDHHTYNGPTDSATDIGEEAAKNAALTHAGLTASQVSKLKAEYDYDDGIALYEVEFKYNNYEYEYEIDAATGAILKYEIDD